MTFDKVRIRFRKDGDLRLVSHHDLMRAFERMLRRAELPFRSTEGFHPQPRVVFALPLSLGIAGLAEVVEIEWTVPVEPEDALARLNRQAPPGLSFFSAKRIELKQTAVPRRTVFRLAVGEASLPCHQKERSKDASPTLREHCEQIMASPELWVEREKPTPRQINIRPYLDSLKCGPEYLEMSLWVTPVGTARADELLRVLELNHLLDAGAVVERTELEILDEIDPAGGPGPVLPTREERGSMVRLLNRPPVQPELRTTVLTAHWGAASGGPIVE